MRLNIWLIICLLASALGAKALPLDYFDDHSPLAQGRWVKIAVDQNGIYQLSYDQLRAMGFDHPERVGIYGRGGTQLPEQFTDYTDDFTPVAILHHDDKVYFYGQGPLNIRYRHEYNDPVNRRFQREYLNTYSDRGYYFLTDSRDDVCHIPTSSATDYDSSKPPYDHCYDYYLHEQELTNFCQSGRLFVGESFIAEDRHSQSFPYDIPGALPGSASLECRFYDNNGTLSTLSVDINGSPCLQSEINRPEQNHHGSPSAPFNREVQLSAPSGTVTINYFPGKYASQAYLDYFLIGARKRIAFVDEQPQFRAFVPKYDTDQYGCVTIGNASADIRVWDVTDSNNATLLPYTLSGNTANVTGLTADKQKGMMIAFDTSKTQLQIAHWQAVDNHDLHAISADQVPHLLIITTPDLHHKAEQLADIHRHYDGIDVLVVDSEQIIDEFAAGTPDAMAYRAFCKMLYDRNPDKLANLLLFGEMHFDNRQILRQQKGQRLLSYQSEESLDMLGSFCITDFFGMLDDTPASKGLQHETLCIGVGVLPIRTPADADIIIDKVAHYITDTSYAYWLGNTLCTADGPDYNEHLNQAEDLAAELADISDDRLQVSKLYVSAYPADQVSLKMSRHLRQGTIFGTYLGHAAIESLSTNRSIWTTKEASRLSNDRLAFLGIGACSVTLPDAGVRGSTEAMLFANDHGIIGGIMSSRKTYSYWNYMLLSTFQQKLFQCTSTDHTEASHPSQARTIGQIYAMTKSQTLTQHTNELAYHLICDPAIILPVASTTMTVNIDADTDDNAIPSLAQGSAYHLHGHIVDHQGSPIDNFNGTLVARLYDTPSTITTNGFTGSKAVDVTYDETIISTIATEVIDGAFQCDIIVPKGIDTSTDHIGKLRLSAYDPDKRIGSLSALDIAYAPHDPATAIVDTTSPIIKSMTVNSSDFTDGDIVTSDITLYATITDDTAIAGIDDTMTRHTYLLLDDHTTLSDLSQHISLSQSGRQCDIALPLDHLAPGTHTLTLHISDIMGNSARHTITFHVCDDTLSGTVTIEPQPVRQSADINIDCDTDSEVNREIIITDLTGQVIFQALTADETLTWNRTDLNGNPVAAGIYHLHCRLTADNGRKGTTPRRTLYLLPL